MTGRKRNGLVWAVTGILFVALTVWIAPKIDREYRDFKVAQVAHHQDTGQIETIRKELMQLRSDTSDELPDVRNMKVAIAEIRLSLMETSEVFHDAQVGVARINKVFLLLCWLVGSFLLLKLAWVAKTS